VKLADTPAVVGDIPSLDGSIGVTPEHGRAEAVESVARVGSWRLDIGSGEVTGSDDTYRIYGLDPDAREVDLADAISSAVHPDDRAAADAATAAAVRDRTARAMEYRLALPDGEVRWVRTVAREECDGAGTVVALAGFVEDITDLKRAEVALRESERHQRMLFDSLGEGFAVHEIIVDDAGVPCDYRFLQVNPAFERLTGLVATKIVGRTVLEVMPETERVWIDRYGVVALTGVAAHLEDYSTVLGRHYEVQAYSPEPGRFATLVSDVTTRKEAEAEIRRTQLLLRSSIESQKDTILFSIDPEYRYLYFNKGHADVMEFAYGTTAELGACILDIITSDGDRVVAKENYDRALAGESHTNIRVFGDVQLAYYESFFNPIVDDQGNIIGATGLARDITARKESESEILRLNAELEERVQERTEELTSVNEELMSANSELIEANMRLEEATRAKSDFLAAMSHELRTPLNSVIGFSDILARGMAGDLNEEQRKQVGMINNSGRHLLELVNEVLDLAKIESGQQVPAIREVDIAATARKMLDTVRPMAEAKGIDMRWACDEELAAVQTDELLVGQILLNLMSNAVKFTESGFVSAGLRRVGSDVLISIEDSGCGIDAEELERVFDDFYQVTPTGGAKSEGTGLGLSVSRHLAESIGARIEIVSEPGQGSAFTLRLPRRPQ
jgi:PAS domain S-box-containing protein